MKRFSIKELPIGYSNEYNLKQMTTTDLKNWKEQGCLDDEETGLLYIEKDNRIDKLFIGNGCPDDTDDITISNVYVAIYFDGDDLMVKAKNEVYIEYIVNEIENVLRIFDDAHSTAFSNFTRTNIKAQLILDLIYDQNNYTNADSKCECWKCEVKSICKVHDKMQRHSRANGGLGLCPKLDERTFIKFVERHLDEYQDIVKGKR